MLRDLSYRYKLPLAFIAAILVTAIALAITSAAKTYDTARQQLLVSAERVGAVLANALVEPLRKDAIWSAYLTVKTVAGANEESSDPPVVVVLDALGRVFVSSEPERFPVLSVTTEFAEEGNTRSGVDDHLVVRVPIVPEQITVGEVILQYPRAWLLPPLYDIARSTAWTTIIVLTVLVPIAWFWGRRVAAPLVHLADSMPKVAALPAEQIELPKVVSRDEIGDLTERFRSMVTDLADKREVERRMMTTDRLAALGRLAAGVAHEINNPLGGMLTALSTYRRHGATTDLREKTLSLLERGLNQIKETVSALLVEAKLETHPLSPEDIEDVRTLILPEVKKKHARLIWSSDIDRPMALPSTQVRQVLINLLLNATKAVDEGGDIACTVDRCDGLLRITVEDNGEPIASAQYERLFEPFSGQDVSGNGLGLWVTYQIVQQFHGEISVDSHPGLTQFKVELPVTN